MKLKICFIAYSILALTHLTLHSMENEEAPNPLRQEASFLYAFMSGSVIIEDESEHQVVFYDFEDDTKYNKKPEWCRTVINNATKKYQPVTAIGKAWAEYSKANTREQVVQTLDRVIDHLTNEDHWQFAQQECYRFIQKAAKTETPEEKALHTYVQYFVVGLPGHGPQPKKFPTTITLSEYLSHGVKKLNPEQANNRR